MTLPVKRLPFNHDNFIKLQNEVEELQDLTLKLNAQLTLKEASTPKVVAKRSTKKGE
jgi:hypothetical protein